MKIRVLMIDDHPSMIEGYKIILGYNNFGYELEVKSAFNCEMAYQLITGEEEFDVVFLDYSLPAFEEKKIKNGLDLALVLRKEKPETKLVVLTSHSEAIILYEIINAVEPEGILVKSDFSGDELIEAFEKVIHGEKFKSITVQQSLSELLSHREYLDEYCRKIITLLSQGIKTKNIPSYLNLSMSAVEKRKAQIKEYFSIEKGNDEDIIREAKKAGLV